MIYYIHTNKPQNESEDLIMEINLTENSYIFQSAKRLLNAELKKCVDLLKENEAKWNKYMDLKLHYINCCVNECDFDLNGAHVSFTAETLNDMFNLFCENNYDGFIEWCKENNIDFDELRYNVGRTSSFYLGELHNNDTNKYTVALAQASYEFNMSDLEFNEDEDGNITLIEDITGVEDIEDMVNSMLALVETMYADLTDKLNDIIKVYDYIADFKKNQVENFKEYVKDNWINNI